MAMDRFMVFAKVWSGLWTELMYNCVVELKIVWTKLWSELHCRLDYTVIIPWSVVWTKGFSSLNYRPELKYGLEWAMIRNGLFWRRKFNIYQEWLECSNNWRTNNLVFIHFVLFLNDSDCFVLQMNFIFIIQSVLFIFPQ